MQVRMHVRMQLHFFSLCLGGWEGINYDTCTIYSFVLYISRTWNVRSLSAPRPGCTIPTTSSW